MDRIEVNRKYVATMNDTRLHWTMNDLPISGGPVLLPSRALFASVYFRNSLPDLIREATVGILHIHHENATVAAMTIKVHNDFDRLWVAVDFIRVRQAIRPIIPGLYRLRLSFTNPFIQVCYSFSIG